MLIYSQGETWMVKLSLKEKSPKIYSGAHWNQFVFFSVNFRQLTANPLYILYLLQQLFAKLIALT